MNRHNQLIGTCGVDCKGCRIFRARDDPELARKIADSYRKRGFVEARSQDVRCLACKGDRVKHWNADCWILKCCVDEKGLEFCYQCQDFPCDKLNEWAREAERYEKALSRLKGMKRSAESSP